MVRRALVCGDLLGILLAFYLSSTIAPAGSAQTMVGTSFEVVLLAISLPVWLGLFKLNGLYDRDEEHADYSTADELFGVAQVVTLGIWAVEVTAWITGLATPQLGRLILFWFFSIVLVTGARAAARGLCRRHRSYLQRVVVVGEGDIGQLVARKIGKHPEYGFQLLGFVDGDPKGRREDIPELETLGNLDQLQSIVHGYDVDRVIVAFSRRPDTTTMGVIRSLRDEDVTVDVVPRLFELVGPRASVHSLEGLALVCLPPAELSRSSLLIKRAVDVCCASIALIVLSPFYFYAAYRIRRGSPGPVIFRQVRLGAGRKPFTALKFRTMKVDTDQGAHRDYVRSISNASATGNTNGVYKLDRDDSVTDFGRWLRKTSLDELPQLINVLRGEMSIVGPRPCIPYEIENFEPHHFDRFLVPQGITGLWQVTARANATFGEALDMDVAYVQGWSLGLDLRLILRTPVTLLRQRRSTA
jgi:exopolysaccharide biosynthesis polyprenyl glycosylphosphotransferase